MNKRIVATLLIFVFALFPLVLQSCTEMPPAETPPQIEPIMRPAQDVRVISINVGYDIQNMTARGKAMVPLLLSYAPDSIGTQECGGYTDWVDFFRDGLVGYERVGHLSNGAIETDEHYSGNYIYYNAEKYECLDWYTFWVTETPSQISAINDSIFRTCTWAVLKDKDTGFKYAHINTHLAFENDEMNEFQTGLIRDVVLRFHQLGMPVFLTGDFNASEGSMSYRIMTSLDAISDSKYLAEKTMSSGTFRGWGEKDLSGGLPIDFCFVTGDMMDIREYQVIDTYVDGVALTDHMGIFVHATVNSLPDNPYVLSSAGIEIKEISSRKYVYEFCFTQADNINLIHRYQVDLLNENGTIVQSRTILSRHLDKEFPESLNCTFSSLTPGTKYMVNIYAVALDTTRSSPVTFEFTSANN